MKQIKLHQWLPSLLLLLVIATGCSKKNYPTNNNAGTEDQYENVIPEDYTPPPVLTISDDKASTNKDGELYYDNEYGYRYWRYCDGKYYIDAKYEQGVQPSKKVAKKKARKKTKREVPQDDNLASTDQNTQ
jgi:hypothetical protein